MLNKMKIKEQVPISNIDLPIQESSCFFNPFLKIKSETAVHSDGDEVENAMKNKEECLMLDIGSLKEKKPPILDLVRKIKSETVVCSDSEMQNTIKLKEENLVLDIDEQNEESFPSSHTVRNKSKSDVDVLDSKIEIKEEPWWLDRTSTEVTAQSELTCASDLQVYSEIKDGANEDSPATESTRLHMETSASTCNTTSYLFTMADLEEEGSFNPAKKNIEFAGAVIHEIYRSNMMETFSVAQTVNCHNSKTAYDHKQSDNFNKCNNNHNKLHICEISNKSFSNWNALKDHIMFLKSERPYKCDICGKCFTQRGHLKTHILTHEGKRAYKCNVCDKCFTQGSNLKTHMVTHEGIRSYKCGVCNKCFTHKCTLKTHMLTHEGKQAYKCDVCNKCFTQRGHLKAHILTHEGTRPYKCDVCNKCFTQRTHLKTHILTHEGKRPYKCDVCNKCFTRKDILKTHILTHEGKRPLKM